jgi:homoserine O-acetyltransferase
MPNASYFEINSAYGHDGFLVETEKISEHANSWLVKEGF